MSAHRFRWLGGLVLVVIVLLVWQNVMLLTELHRLHNHVEEAVATAEDASDYARRAWDAADNPRRIRLLAPRGEDMIDRQGRPLTSSSSP